VGLVKSSAGSELGLDGDCPTLSVSLTLGIVISVYSFKVFAVLLHYAIDLLDVGQIAGVCFKQVEHY
jgi:hypothetical protein